MTLILHLDLDLVAGVYSNNLFYLQMYPASSPVYDTDNIW